MSLHNVLPMYLYKCSRDVITQITDELDFGHRLSKFSPRHKDIEMITNSAHPWQAYPQWLTYIKSRKWKCRTGPRDCLNDSKCNRPE